LPLLRRREIAAYLLLYKAGVEEYGEAIELVRRRLCTTKRTARNIVKRLARVGAIRVYRRGDTYRVEVAEPLEVLELMAGGYIASRSEKCGG